MIKQTFVVGEIGSNFDNNLEIALKYVRACKRAGADAIKFQTLKRDRLIAPKIWADGRPSDNPVYLGFSNLELSDEWHFAIKRAADEEGIEFMSTPFHLEAVDLLEKVGVSAYKIASGDITFRPLLEAIGRTGKKVILSTGGSSLEDVETAVKTLEQAGAGGVTLLHCVSNYPPQWSEMNLRAMVTMKEAFGLPVGISDHTPGSVVSTAAVALGAVVVEKHVTFDRGLPGPDHPFAMTMDEFADMVQQIRNIELALGTGQKEPADSEGAKQHRMRRGVYAPDTLEPVEGDEGIWLRPQHYLTRTRRP